jgi:hypothetical protein
MNLSTSSSSFCKRFSKFRDFIYLEKEDSFQCSAGKKLTISLKSRASRIIQTDEHEGLRQSMSKKMATAQTKKTYDARKITVEPAFGHIKNSGFSEFSLRRIFIGVHGVQLQKNGPSEKWGAIHLKMRIECDISSK